MSGNINKSGFETKEYAGMLTRPQPHEAEATTHEGQDHLC